MSSKKAVCDCKDNSEDELVVAIKTSRLGFTDKWGMFTWLMFVILTIGTGGFWLSFVIGWNFDWLLNPPYVCQFCSKKIENSQFR